MGTIIYVGGELPDKNAAAHRVLNNAKALREIGYNVVLIGSSKSIDFHTQILSTKTELCGFVSFFMPYPSNTIEWIKYISSGDSIISVIEKYDDLSTVVLYNYPSIALFKIRKYCIKHGIKLVADITEWYQCIDGNLIRRIIKKVDTFIRMRLLHKHLDGLIVISRFLQEYYKSCRNVHYIPPLVDISDEKWIITHKNHDGIMLKLIYAGEPGRKDSLNELINAVNKTKRLVILSIVGISKENYYELNKDKTLCINSERIKFLGRLSHEKVISLIKSSNYSCFFRKDTIVNRAGFPTKFGEALACNTGVITNKISDLEEYILQNKNGLFVESLKIEDIENVLENAPMVVDVERDLLDYHRYLNEFKQLMENLFYE